MATENSAFSEIILRLQARIKDRVPDIRMIDEDKGQLEDYDHKTGKPPVSFPCVLIGFENSEGQDMGDNTQMVSTDIVLRLGFPPYSSAASWFPADIRKKALSYFDLEWQLYKALHGYQLDETGITLSWRRANTERREDTIRVRDIRYVTGWEERSAQPTRTRMTLDVDAQAEFEAPPGTDEG